jgi:gliding motility-associated-like protein
LGNFEPYSALTIIPSQTGPSPSPQMAYYYYDDVCVLDLDGLPGTTTVSDTSICPGDQLLLDAGGGLRSYLWDDGDTTRYKMISDTGTYWVKSIDKSNCSFVIDSFYVHLKGADVAVDLGADTVICAGESFILNAYDESFWEYHWSTGSEDSAIQVNAPGLYYVFARSDCYSGSDSILVGTVAKPEAHLPDDTMLCNGVPLLLSSEQAGMSYSWNTGSDACCIEITRPGTYLLRVANICGEEAVDSISVFYSGCDHCLLVPTAFSPNGDGLNDRFMVFNNCVLNTFKLSIYNRFGQLVYSGFDPEKGWDGTYQGRPADAGVYFYHIEASPLIRSLPDIKASGDITLIK